MRELGRSRKRSLASRFCPMSTYRLRNSEPSGISGVASRKHLAVRCAARPKPKVRAACRSSATRQSSSLTRQHATAPRPKSWSGNRARLPRFRIPAHPQPEDSSYGQVSKREKARWQQGTSAGGAAPVRWRPPVPPRAGAPERRVRGRAGKKRSAVRGSARGEVRVARDRGVQRSIARARRRQRRLRRRGWGASPGPQGPSGVGNRPISPDQLQGRIYGNRGNAAPFPPWGEAHSR
jgi:hypothetical protein